MKLSLPTHVVLGSMILAAAGQAHAGNAYNSQVTVSYTITDIANLDNPGLVKDLAILASFEPNPDGSDYVPDPLPAYASINAVNNAVSQNLLPAVGSIFSYTFSVGGSLSGGLNDLFTYHEGLFGLEFENSGNDRYAIQFSLDYQFNVNASGDGALSSITLDHTASFVTYNPVTDFAYLDSLGVTAGNMGPVAYLLALAPQASASATAWVGAVNHLPPPAAVPLPGAVWLFLSGFGVVAGVRRKAAGLI